MGVTQGGHSKLDGGDRGETEMWLSARLAQNSPWVGEAEGGDVAGLSPPCYPTASRCTLPRKGSIPSHPQTPLVHRCSTG